MTAPKPISESECHMNEAPKGDTFENWIAMKSISLSHFPNFGQCAIVYVLRDGRDGEILKFGKTGCARDRIFKNYIGGNGGNTVSVPTSPLDLS
jgi:hypothetical protein